MMRSTRGQQRCTVHQKAWMFALMCSSMNTERSPEDANVFSPRSGRQTYDFKCGEWISSCLTPARKSGSYIDSIAKGCWSKRSASRRYQVTGSEKKSSLASMRRSRVVRISWKSVGASHCCMMRSCSSAGNSAYRWNDSSGPVDCLWWMCW
jgi:hypothetical protein